MRNNKLIFTETKKLIFFFVLKLFLIKSLPFFLIPSCPHLTPECMQIYEGLCQLVYKTIRDMYHGRQTNAPRANRAT